MTEKVLLDYLRKLARILEQRGTTPVDDTTIESLEDIQQNISAIYTDYEENPAPAGGETLRELMMEALHLIHEGLEEFLLFSEDFDKTHLSQGVAYTEEGHDIMDSIRYSVEHDTQWTSSATVH